MKKLLFAILAVTTVGFYSCETEPSGSSLEDTKISAGITTEDGCLEESLAPIPEITDACILGQGATSSTGAYWDIEILDGTWAGVYPGWCIDEDLGFDTSCFQADVISSYEDLSGLPFEVADNFDSMNWLLNQEIIGTTSGDGTPYTYGDFQAAIWIMVEGEPCINCTGLGDWDADRAQEIVDRALNEGDGFVPASGDFTGIVLNPENNQQSLLIPYKLECKPALASCETAFARETNGDNCFIDNGFKRWGWTIGPISDGHNESYEIYAGAGKCDISKGTFVGTVDVSYIGGEVEVAYNFLDGVVVNETHTYAGNTMFPTNKKGKTTVAPGQYSIQEDLGDEIYVIAHAVVCEEED
ncbi:hypothetical protein [Flagellimonas sp. S3867]|uniref:hypothetical protein n=1 Tax=Flagellimonas sp. S3867 TaxID=2768063 RepID=UPI001686664B|nr:hypothetical protein [Flagellimonas sp. S3867]